MKKNKNKFPQKVSKPSGRLAKGQKTGGLMADGLFSGHKKGFGFVTPEGGLVKEDIFIPPSLRGGARSGDMVLCRVTPKSRGFEGEIIKIKQFGPSVFVGTYQRLKRKGTWGLVENDSGDPPVIVHGGNAKTGQRVVVELLRDQREGQWTMGKIVKILGRENDPWVDVFCVLYNQQIPMDFPEEVLKAANAASQTVREQDLAGRKDFRDQMIITIDGEYAKDLDDAVCVKRLDDRWLLGVHIADVAHYVRGGGALDKEARLRGTSVYPVGMVVPMLPEALSNGICSLSPNVDRLTLSCEMEISDQGQILHHEISQGVIKSVRRMTYTDVAQIVENEASPLRQTYSDIVPMIMDMAQLAKILREMRSKRGAVDFNLKECEITLDKNATAVKLTPVYRNVAMEMIEEFMLACNETVAKAFCEPGQPFIFRSHIEPSEEKLDNLRAYAGGLGLILKGSEPSDIQDLLEQAKQAGVYEAVSSVSLRSMRQAEYTPDNLGHYGLAAKFYCHFTSPIRRYPDLMIHRIIKRTLGDSTKIPKSLTQLSIHCSRTERRAETAEREVVAMKKIEFMASQLGKKFTGTVSGVTSRGFYVTLENTAEGFVPIDSMDGFYLYDERRMRLSSTAERSRPFPTVIGLGDRIEIRVVSANKATMRLEFEPATARKNRRENL